MHLSKSDSQWHHKLDLLQTKPDSQWHHTIIHIRFGQPSIYLPGTVLFIIEDHRPINHYNTVIKGKGEKFSQSTVHSIKEYSLEFS